MRYAVFLRGINVGGVKLTNEKLLEIAASAGFGRARALLASGNLLLDSELPADRVQAELENALSAACGADVPCYVRSLEQLKALLAEDDSDPEGFHHYLLFCREPLLEALSPAYAQFTHAPGEKLFGQTGHTDIHWIVEKDNTLGDFGSKVLGRKYRDQLTSRNLRTVQKAVAALADPEAFEGKPGKRQ